LKSGPKSAAHRPYAENLLLAGLTKKVFDRLPFKLVEIKLGEVIYPAHRRVDAAYFPLSGMISLVHSLDDGETVEVGLVGREGFVGLPLLFGTDYSPVEALVQGDGIALSLPRGVFRTEFMSVEPMRAKLLAYTSALYSQTIQTIACNTRHNVPQRLARWLLEAHDRMRTDKMPIRHSSIGFMLGCRRAGISQAVGVLRKEGVIELLRGAVYIKNRRGLEDAACSCYGTVRSAYARALGPGGVGTTNVARRRSIAATS